MVSLGEVQNSMSFFATGMGFGLAIGFTLAFISMVLGGLMLGFFFDKKKELGE